MSPSALLISMKAIVACAALAMLAQDRPGDLPVLREVGDLPIRPEGPPHAAEGRSFDVSPRHASRLRLSGEWTLRFEPFGWTLASEAPGRSEAKLLRDDAATTELPSRATLFYSESRRELLPSTVPGASEYFRELESAGSKASPRAAVAESGAPVVARLRMARLAYEVATYRIAESRLPASLLERDPWERPFELRAVGGAFDITSLGADGRPGGAGDDRDLSYLRDVLGLE